MSAKQVLVTGANGWLGQTCLAEYSREFETVALSRNPAIPMASRTLPIYTDALGDVEPQGVVHLAFRTKDQQVQANYKEDNRRLTGFASNLIQTTKPAWVISIGSGDEVFARDCAGLSLYGQLKLEEKTAIDQACYAVGASHVRIRLWGASGRYMQHHQNYAFGSFLHQALQHDRIVVNAQHAVWRRYCDAGQLMRLALSLAESGNTLELDSGGPLVELHDLARSVAVLVSCPDTPNIEVVSSLNPLLQADDYFPRGFEYEEYAAEMGIEPMSIEDQISNTIPSLGTGCDCES